METCHTCHLSQNERAKYGDTHEVILTELIYTHAPTWPPEEIAAWYAVAKDISEKAYSGATPQKESER